MADVTAPRIVRFSDVAAFVIATVAPSPGEPDFPASTALFFGLLTSGVALARKLDRETVQWHGLLGAFGGGVAGLAVYLFGLVSGLY